MSRPAGSVGEVRQALLDAAQALATPTQAPTLAELAARAQVGRELAKTTVKNMTAARQLRIVRTRRVPYRNRPVAEYAPAESVAQAPASAPGGGFDFGVLISTWIA